MRTKEQIAKYMKEWRIKSNYDHSPKRKAYKKIYTKSQKYKDNELRRRLKKRYGITVEQYNLMFEKQCGLCKICGGNNGSGTLCVDHNHTTGKVRGLLCLNCNMVLGLTYDNVQTLLNLVSYLKENQ